MFTTVGDFLDLLEGNGTINIVFLDVDGKKLAWLTEEESWVTVAEEVPETIRSMSVSAMNIDTTGNVTTVYVTVV